MHCFQKKIISTIKFVQNCLPLQYFRLKVFHNNKSLVDNYFNSHIQTYLHIGCGNNLLNGWLNSDYFPSSKKAIHIDATKKFRFEDTIFDHVFSEHMIEHITYSEGQQMLNECYRILKQGGKIRISTPDLAFLINLYNNDKSKLQSEYIKWSTDKFITSAPYCDDTFVINNFVRNWGHLFIYDEKTLRYALEQAGFKDIIKCELNNSAVSSLCNLENEKRMPKYFLKLESLTLEGTK